MEASSKKGLSDGGLIESDLSTAMIEEYDPSACMLSNPKQVIIEDHRLGQLKYEYKDEGTNPAWTLRGGRPGVTGMRQVAPGNLQWLSKNDLPNDAKKYVWQKITTDEYGNPTSVSQCIKTQASMSSSSWDPVTCTPGTIWRRLASIEPDTSVDPHPSCKHSWGMKAINENNLYMMPMARRYGNINSEDIFIDQGSDLKDRGSSSHWTAVMHSEVGLSNLIQSVGELGGTFVYQTRKSCGGCSDYGVGIASGVEFYDPTTYKECYNKKEMRPKSTSACVNLGYGGSLKIENVNKKHPWQFKITATPISVSDCGTLADGRPQYSWPEESYLCWPTTPGYSCKRKGAVTGELRRVIDGLICEGDQGEIHQNLQYAVGEVKDGDLGIRTATWRDPGSNPDWRYATNFMWNRQGGVVTGIVEDVPFDSPKGKSYIDRDGMIHVRNMCMSCAYPGGGTKVVTNKMLAQATSETSHYSWGWSGQGFKTSLYPCETYDYVSGQCNGVYSGIISNVIPAQAVSCTNIQTFSGETQKGVLAIGPSIWHANRGTGDGSEDHPFNPLWHPPGGLIRGILADISLCDDKVPFIDSLGFIHIWAISVCAGGTIDPSKKYYYQCRTDLEGQPMYWSQG